MDPISDEFLRQEYGITEQYSKDYPEASAEMLLVVRSTEEALRAARESAQSSKKLTNSIIELGESSKELHEQVKNSEKETVRSLQNLKNSSSEMKEMTSNIANFAKRFFKPVKNGFYLLTGRRELAAVSPRENQLAIEDNPENTISDTDPTNQPPVDGKKNFVSLLMFFVLWGSLYFARAGEQKNL